MEKREYSFDILRAISMFMVIVIHVSNVFSRSYGNIGNLSFLHSLIYNTICRISVPIFFMISGTLLLERKFDKVKFKKRILKYLLLIIVWNIIYLVWEFFYLSKEYDNLYMLLIEPFRAHLWFLYTILILYSLQPLAKKVLEKCNKKMKVLLLILWIFISTYSLFDDNSSNIVSILIYLGYFVLGKYIYDFIKKNSYIKKNKKVFNVLAIVLIVTNFLLSIFLNYYFSLKLDKFYNSFFAYRSLFIVIPSILFFILVVLNYEKSKENKLIMFFSDLSLGVYLIHGIFLDIIKTYMNYNLNLLISIPFYSVIIFAFSIISVWFLMKFKILRKVLR